MTEKEAYSLILKQLEVSIAARALFAEECARNGRADTPEFERDVEILKNLDTSNPYVIQRQLRDIYNEARRDADRYRTDATIKERMKYSPAEREADRERADKYHLAVRLMLVAQTELTNIDMFIDAIE